MNIFGWLTGGVAKSIENIASEWIETDKEKAEAQSVMVKALDPNGKMRRDISRTVMRLYALYIGIALILTLCQAFDLGPLVMQATQQVRAVDAALASIKELFVPISTLAGLIVSASFGVNFTNSVRGK